jgi:predicted HNH restriction endonuclease
VHHLFPRSVARRKNLAMDELPTADLCPPCHKTVHRHLENRKLAELYASVDELRRHPEIEKFLAWVRKQPGAKAIRVR